MDQFFTGAIKTDPRTPEQQARDFKHEEALGMGIPYMWTEKKDWVKLSVRDQDGSGSCGAQSGAKAIESLIGRVESAVPIFRSRINYPSSGMNIQDIGSILLHKKTTSESLCPSQLKNDQQMDATPFGVTADGIDGYYFLPLRDKLDMDLLAAALEKGHPLIIGFSTTYKDYTGVPVPSTPPTTIDHFVCAAPHNYTIHNDEKAVIVDDSALHATALPNAQRIFTETFLKSQCWGIMALIPHKEIERPKHMFSQVLQYGMTNDDVKALQEVLIYEGFLQAGFNTGFFGKMTGAALKLWQVHHNMYDFQNEIDITKIRFGKKSIAEANNLYA